MQQTPGRDFMLGTTDHLGKRRLQGIHNRVAYMVDKFLYEEYKDYSPNPWQLCERCEMNEDINWSKSCAENKHYFLKYNKLAWVCEAVEESANIPEVSWDRQNLMTRNVYMKIIEDTINEMEPRQAVLCVWKLNRDLTVLQPHMKRTCTLVEQNLMNRYCCVAPMWLLSLYPFTEFRIWNNSSSSDVLYIQASISPNKSKSKTTSHHHLLLHDCIIVAV